MISMLREKNWEIMKHVEEGVQGETKLLFMITTLKGEGKRTWGFVYNDRDYFSKENNKEKQTIRNSYMSVDV